MWAAYERHVPSGAVISSMDAGYGREMSYVRRWRGLSQGAREVGKARSYRPAPVVVCPERSKWPSVAQGWWWKHAQTNEVWKEGRSGDNGARRGFQAVPRQVSSLMSGDSTRAAGDVDE